MAFEVEVLAGALLSQLLISSVADQDNSMIDDGVLVAVVEDTIPARGSAPRNKNGSRQENHLVG